MLTILELDELITEIDIKIDMLESERALYQDERDMHLNLRKDILNFIPKPELSLPPGRVAYPTVLFNMDTGNIIEVRYHSKSETAVVTKGKKHIQVSRAYKLVNNKNYWSVRDQEETLGDSIDDFIITKFDSAATKFDLKDQKYLLEENPFYVRYVEIRYNNEGYDSYYHYAAMSGSQYAYKVRNGVQVRYYGYPGIRYGRTKDNRPV